MNIACITQVRDECDIIELFVKINARVFDHIYIIDNNSVDGTGAILEQLQRDGYPITTTFNNDNTYNQDGIVTAALHYLGTRHDWYCFLDADEFIREPKEDIIKKFSDVPQYLTPKCMWRSWIPISLDYPKHNAPLYHCFNALENENHITYKAVIDRKKAHLVRINHGNHAWIANHSNQLLPDLDCRVRIDHFPVRSAEQIISKAVLNHYRQTVRTAANRNFGPVRTFFQLSAIHNCLRESNFKVTQDMLRRFGYMYNVEIPPTGNDTQSDKVTDEKFGFEELDEIKYLDQSKISLGTRFDKQMEIMDGVITRMREEAGGPWFND